MADSYMKTPIEEANDRAMESYRRMVDIQMTETAVHVTLNGEHFTNDADAFERAMKLLRENGPGRMSR